jgi:hypothetical protein
MKQEALDEIIKKEIRRVYAIYTRNRKSNHIKLMTNTDCYEEILKELLDAICRPKKRQDRLIFQDFEYTEAIIKDKIL